MGGPFAIVSGREIRQLVVKPYRMLYEVQERTSTVVILRIWHGARRDPVAIELVPAQE